MKCLIFIFVIFTHLNTYAQWKSTQGPQGGNIDCIIFDGTTIFVGNQGGLFRSVNDGEIWEPIDNGLTFIAINVLTKSGSLIFAGTNGGGVFRSINNGETWTEINDGLVDKTIWSISVVGSNVFVGTENGVYHSTNNGNLWTKKNNGLNNNIVYSFANSGNSIFAGTKGNGVYHSTDNGSTWNQVNNGLTELHVNSITTVSNILFAGTGGGGVFRSIDKGNNWVPINSGLPNSDISTLSVGGTDIYVGTYGGGIYKSINNGNSWIEINKGISNGNITSIAINNNKLFTGTKGGGIFKSTNSGGDWANVGLYSIPALSIVQLGPNIFVGTEESGVFRTMDNGNSWIGTGIEIPQMASCLAANKETIFAGTFGGVYRSQNNGQNWVNIGIKTGYIKSIVAIDSTIFAAVEDRITLADDGIYRAVKNGIGGWTKVSKGLPKNFARPTVLSTNNIDLLIGSQSHGIYKYNIKSDSCIKIFDACCIYSLIIEGQNIYAGSENGKIFRSLDNGINWETININSGSGSKVNSIVIKDNSIFASTDFPGYIFQSKDNGHIWNDISEGLSAPGVNTLAIIENIIFAGTSWGVYLRNLSELISSNQEFSDKNLEMAIIPNPIIGSLKINKIKNIDCVKIQNTIGETLYNFNRIQLDLLNSELDLTDLISGIYIISIFYENEKVYSQKIMIAK
ncbi:MAG: hypothetical protein IPM48_01850 [Saprospiraceae bacterium]|nr:hypothetical protein [Saprospiraceae bacterium]